MAMPVKLSALKIMENFVDVDSICQRCTTPLKNSEQYVCGHCVMLVGPKPRGDQRICEFCGDAWIHSSLYFCIDCFKVEPIEGTCQ